MRIRTLALCVISLVFLASCAPSKNILLDDFEGPISGGPQGTVDFGSGNGSSLQVSASTEIKYSGKQSLKLDYDAVAGGYMYAALGFGLDAHNARWLVSPEKIIWRGYKGISFYMYGSDSKVKVAFDIKDNGYELWRFMLEDNFKGWKQIICPFNEFFARADWQPQAADKNAVLNFPVKSFQFEPRPVAKGTLYFDDVELIKK